MRVRRPSARGGDRTETTENNGICEKTKYGGRRCAATGRSPASRPGRGAWRATASGGGATTTFFPRRWPHVAPIDHTPAHHQRQGRLHIGQGWCATRTNPARRLRGPRERPGGETMRQVLNRLAFDKALFGNAFSRSGDRRAADLPVALPPGCVTLPRGPRLAARAAAPRLGGFQSGRGGCCLWALTERQEDGTVRSMVHYRRLRTHVRTLRRAAPTSRGFNVSAIAYKTDRWNISRLDNSFQLSGVMMLDSTADSEEQAERIIRTAEQKFAGNPGQVMFVLKRGERRRQLALHTHHLAERGRLEDAPRPGRVGHRGGALVVPHAQRTRLRGGFSAERILHEYEVALNTVILGEQAELLEPIRRVIGGRWGATPRRSKSSIGRRPGRKPALHEGVGGAQGRRTGLRSAGREAAGLFVGNHEVQRPQHRVARSARPRPDGVAAGARDGAREKKDSTMKTLITPEQVVALLRTPTASTCLRSRLPRPTSRPWRSGASCPWWGADSTGGCSAAHMPSSWRSTRGAAGRIRAVAVQPLFGRAHRPLRQRVAACGGATSRRTGSGCARLRRAPHVKARSLMLRASAQLDGGRISRIRSAAEHP